MFTYNPPFDNHKVYWHNPSLLHLRKSLPKQNFDQMVKVLIGKEPKRNLTRSQATWCRHVADWIRINFSSVDWRSGGALKHFSSRCLCCRWYRSCRCCRCWQYCRRFIACNSALKSLMRCLCLSFIITHTVIVIISTFRIKLTVITYHHQHVNGVQYSRSSLLVTPGAHVVAWMMGKVAELWKNTPQSEI